MFKRRLAAIIVAILAIQPVAAFANCTLYQHRDFGGARFVLGNGDTLFMKNNPNPGIGTTTNGHGYEVFYNRSWNDQVSSFKVSAGCTLTLWKNHDYKGDRWATSQSYKYVGSRWNDEASTAQCLCRPVG